MTFQNNLDSRVGNCVDPYDAVYDGSGRSHTWMLDKYLADKAKAKAAAKADAA